MKKIILASLVAVSILSCSSNDNESPEITGKNTTIVMAKFGVGEEAFPTSKGLTVNRGTIPTTINRITVHVENINTAVPSSQTIFDMVSFGGASDFFIEDVASGMNTFTAKATTTGTAKTAAYLYNFVSNADTDAKLDAEKSEVPYANYEAVKSTNIILGTPQTIAFSLLTDNGRLICNIETGAILSASNRKIEVTKQRFDSTGSPIDQQPSTIDISSDKSILYVWNDDTSLAGSYLQIFVKVYNADGVTIEKTFQKKTTIKASTGITSKITITGQGLTESINEGTFSFPVWTEENE